MWKRGVRRASRNLPVYFRHLKLMVVAWVYRQRLWTPRHTGLPFGSVGAVYAGIALPTYAERFKSAG